MKYLILNLIFCLTISAQEANYDKILLQDLRINGNIILGAEVKIITEVLGYPKSVGNYYSEIDDENWEDYDYNGNHLYFYDKKLVSFDLDTNAMYLENPNCAVGNDIFELRHLYPKSFESRDVGDVDGFLSIYIKNTDGQLTYQVIHILFDPNTGLIRSIVLDSLPVFND